MTWPIRMDKEEFRGVLAFTLLQLNVILRQVRQKNQQTKTFPDYEI